jgi:hypothetical protein
MILGRLKDGRRKPSGDEVEEHNKVELYEVITKTDDFGIVTKHLIFEDEPQFIFLGVEYVGFEDDRMTIPLGKPVFL